LDEMSDDGAMAVFRALGDPIRLELMLVLGEGDGVSVTELADWLLRTSEEWDVRLVAQGREA
jgi:DNA-binding transcriptional ArsR family regulator